MKILYLEDDEFVSRAIQRMLKLRFTGSEVLHVTGPKAGHDAIQAGMEPDLILSDYDMIGGTGLDLYDNLKVQKPYLAQRFVLLTGNLKAADACELNNVPYLMKPCSTEELVAMIDRVANS